MNIFGVKKQKPKPPETTAADLHRLAELSQLVALHGQALEAQCALMSTDIGKYLPAVMESFADYKVVANELIVLTERFNLSERHAIKASLEVAEAEIKKLRAGCIEVPASEIWPSEIEER